MAGDWIKFELATLDKPEVYQIAELSDIDPDAVVGKLMRVWGWFDQQTEIGNAPSVTKKLLDRLTGIAGFCEYMKSVGWMTEADGKISLPHFERHNGKTAKNRLLTAKRAANHRASSNKSNAAIVTPALPKEDVDVEKKEDQHNTHNAGAPTSDFEPEQIEEPPLPVDPKAPVEMTLDWEPDTKLLKNYALRMTLPVEIFTSEATAAFVCHYTASGRLETQDTWVSLLVKWIKTDQNKASNVRQFPQRDAQARHSGFDTRDYKAGLTARGDGTYDF
ncbi:DnaT-like ssDNA-binding domain-containing protein [Pseudomonas umsongensis]|uniref:DnaT-like ssDNA-binding domain-containing protein n=1 Tax=Pseudomonas umsongensis TaxID=198618 RepID=UPI002009E0F7|nr:DnaT-like ssDNA-binding domain-containing protein [Pseudomonas umsongensis]MCK8685341.1 DnaT-like ssDNA-binding domain-containing protein [Pseudomonas umsongensis]